jgi:pseudouridine-5'-phosphate glycosidase
MSDTLEIHPSVREALASGAPVVALESTVIAHGLPAPRNVQVAERLEAVIREAGATPATVGLLDGRAVIGLTQDQIGRLAASGTSRSAAPADNAESEQVAKVSLRDIGPVLAAGRVGATTVASTAHLAARAGIRVFSTGGIGGVHRGGETSLDISADLLVLARTPIAVVCAGAKAILDLGRTLEVLETAGVPVVGYRTREFPAFYTRETGLPLEHQVDSPEDAARLLGAHWGMGLETGVVLCNPPAAESALLRAEVEVWIARADSEAATAGVGGNELTPWLLARLAELSGGRTVEANVALLEDNARLAARVAVALAA